MDTFSSIQDLTRVTLTEADHRVSARGIGASAIIVICIIGGFIVLLDINVFIKHLRFGTQG